jgi:hypothetical protein
VAGTRPDTAGDDRPTAVIPVVTAESARTLVEDFEAGVRRAQTQVLPVVGAPTPGVPQAGTPLAAPRPAVVPSPTVPPAAVPPTAARPPAVPPAAAAPASLPRPAPAPLTRRRPGATLQGQPDFGTTSGPADAPPDPDEARALVEQFEAGVFRALGEVRSNRQREEGSTR